MEEKIIHLNQTVYELCSKYPELPQVLAEIGFQDITKPGMVSTVGRFMTLPKGAVAKKISIDKIRQSLIDRGYRIEE